MAFPNYPANLHIDADGGELRARAFACLAEIISQRRLFLRVAVKLATNSRFSKMLSPEENKGFRFFLSGKSDIEWSWHEPS
jgi:hypothetical protein